MHSHGSNEPPDIHVDRNNLSAKFWPDHVQLAKNIGFSPKYLRAVARMIVEHQQELQVK